MPDYKPLKSSDLLVEVINWPGECVGVLSLVGAGPSTWVGRRMEAWAWDGVVRILKRWRQAGVHNYHVLLLNESNRQVLVPYGERI